MDDFYFSYKGDDPNIDLEYKIPAVLMDAICYAFASLSDEELNEMLLSASYFDTSQRYRYVEFPEIYYGTEISSNTVDRVSVNLYYINLYYIPDCSKPYSLDVNMKFKNRHLFDISFKLNNEEQSDLFGESVSNRFVYFFMLLDIPVGAVNVYGKHRRIPFRIDSLEDDIPLILKELNDDNNSGRFNEGLCLDVLDAFIEKIGMDRFIEYCHENNYAELLMVALNLRQGKDESKPELHL